MEGGDTMGTSTQNISITKTLPHPAKSQAPRSAGGLVKWMATTWLLCAGRSAAAALTPPGSTNFLHLDAPNCRGVPVGSTCVRRLLQQPAGVAALPQSAENTFAAQPERFQNQDVLTDLPASLSLYGALQSSPRPGDVYWESYYSNPHFNAMLVAAVRDDPAQFARRISTQRNEAGRRWHEVLLYHAGRAYRIPVDTRVWAVEFDEGELLKYRGNAVGFSTLAVDVDLRVGYFGVAVEKAFIKLVDTFAASYTVAANRTEVTVTARLGDPRAPGYPRLRFTDIEPTLEALTGAPVRRLSLAGTDDASLWRAISGVGKAGQVGILTLVADGLYANSTAWSEAKQRLDFASGNRCSWASGASKNSALYDPAPMNCDLKNRARLYLLTQYSYPIFAADEGSASLRLRDPNGADGGFITENDPYARTTDDEVFTLPLSLARDLNATIYISTLARNQALRPSPSVLAPSPAAAPGDVPLLAPEPALAPAPAPASATKPGSELATTPGPEPIIAPAPEPNSAGSRHLPLQGALVGLAAAWGLRI